MALKKTNVADDFNKTVEELDQSEMRKLNDESPVSDEDGVVRDEPLLAGYLDENGVLHTTFDYREMTGRDEEAISKAEIRSNGAKLVNTLVERCVMKIGSIDKRDVPSSKWSAIIKSLLGGDIDYMMFKIRELSIGNKVEFVHKCPSCGQKLVTEVSMNEFKIREFKGEREIPFELSRGYREKSGKVHKTGTIRLPNGSDREIIMPLLKKNISTATTALITRCVRFEDGSFALTPFVQEMSIKDRNILEEIIKENTFGVDTTIDGLSCDSCGLDISGEIGQSDFF